MIDGRIIVRDAEVEGSIVDVVLDAGRIDVIGASLAIDDADEVIDAGGGALIPGLHDHHVHLLAMAARREGVDVAECVDPEAFDAMVRDAVRASDGWVRVAGHDEHRHGRLDRVRLDALAPGALVRVQHRSGLAWTLSSSALSALDITEVDPSDAPSGIERDANGDATGRLLRMDGWLADRLGVRTPSLIAVSRELTELGITGVTDATPALGGGRAGVLRDAVLDGHLRQRVVVLGADDPSEVEGWARLGPAKIVIDELDDPDPTSLAMSITERHASGRPVAVHAVSRLETVATIAAFELAGSMPGDRIEHGSVLPFELDETLSRLGITVIIQPSFVRERGDHYLREVDPDDLPILHRAASFLDHGVRLAAGSDAPVTTIDPWSAIATASTRRTLGGEVVGSDERVTTATALGWYLADPSSPGTAIRRVREGAPADLCLLHRPLDAVLSSPSAHDVRATVIDGRLHVR